MRVVLFCVVGILCALASVGHSARPIGLAHTIRNGLTGDSCTKMEECGGNRNCAPRNAVTSTTCDDGRDDCICKPGEPKTCKTRDDCEDGEVCAISEQTSDAKAECRSSDSVKKDDGYKEVGGTVAAPSPSANDVCIGVHLLSQFSNKQLVFDKHLLAHVLCDSRRNCATAGHMVMYNGQAMMMRTYCDMVSCKREVMEVNSPRYSRGLRVQSASRKLEFTAFAARYETRTEEKLLGAAVRVGL